jgi:hypothetical protein
MQRVLVEYKSSRKDLQLTDTFPEFIALVKNDFKLTNDFSLIFEQSDQPQTKISDESYKRLK